MKRLLLLSALACAAPLAAQNRIDDYETRPNATYYWQPGASLASGFAGYTFTGGTLKVSTAGSVSGDQSLEFSASAGTSLTFTSGTAGGGVPSFLI